MENMSYLILIGAAVVALAALAALVNYVISIVRGFRKMHRADNPPRNPPLPEALAKEYATKRDVASEIAELKAELSAERERVDGIFREQFAQLRDLTTQLGEWQRGIERLIGKIEGKVESK